MNHDRLDEQETPRNPTTLIVIIVAVTIIILALGLTIDIEKQQRVEELKKQQQLRRVQNIQDSIESKAKVKRHEELFDSVIVLVRNKIDSLYQALDDCKNSK